MLLSTILPSPFIRCLYWKMTKTSWVWFTYARAGSGGRGLAVLGREARLFCHKGSGLKLVWRGSRGSMGPTVTDIAPQPPLARLFGDLCLVLWDWPATFPSLSSLAQVYCVLLVMVWILSVGSSDLCLGCGGGLQLGSMDQSAGCSGVCQCEKEWTVRSRKGLVLDAWAGKGQVMESKW